jgi:hypothetical protein
VEAQKTRVPIVEDHAHEGSYGNEDSIVNGMRGRSCHTVVNTLSKFCPHPETLWEAEFRGHGRM